ncbi:MAG TPA: FAD-dependent oxidoreductase [Nitrospirota bacterium]|nr:FAD-dependent oxidoreductase [Nitrospirota bacterium]
MLRDPVCNMDVREDICITAECSGVVHYFCSEGCRDKFLKEMACKLLRTSYDLIIIGGGPAGLTAAVYASTMKIDAFLIAKDLGGQAVDSTKIENYMGYDFITGPELIEKFREQLVRSHYIDHVLSEVERIQSVEEGFRVTTSEIKTYAAKAVIIATGMTRKKLGVGGEEKFQRKGVFYGNIQDFSFVQDKDVAVIGGGNSALQLVESLKSIAGNIYVVSATKLTADRAIIERISNISSLRIYEEFKITEFTGNNTLSGITIRKMAGEETICLPVQGVFIAIGFQPNSFLVSNLVELNEHGEIVIHYDCSTSRPGIFAAGDITNAFGKRIIIASGEGAKAALGARQYLLNLRRKKEATACA